ncbi:hypothetical protein DFH06DRAFT_1305904 [Mycena polygramma]|nr:hypothetical protein DFH06DRAFT_1305904 [Mycena polygramma]
MNALRMKTCLVGDPCELKVLPLGCKPERWNLSLEPVGGRLKRARVFCRCANHCHTAAESHRHLKGIWGKKWVRGAMNTENQRNSGDFVFLMPESTHKCLTGSPGILQAIFEPEKLAGKVPQRGCAAATGRIAVYVELLYCMASVPYVFLTGDCVSGFPSQKMVQTIAVVTKVYTERLGGDEQMEITRKTERLEGRGDDGDGVELDRYTLNSESWTTMVYEPSSLMVTGRGIKQMSVRRHLVSVTTLGNHQGCHGRLTLTLELHQENLKYYIVPGLLYKWFPGPYFRLRVLQTSASSTHLHINLSTSSQAASQVDTRCKHSPRKLATPFPHAAPLQHPWQAVKSHIPVLYG